MSRVENKAAGRASNLTSLLFHHSHFAFLKMRDQHIQHSGTCANDSLLH